MLADRALAAFRGDVPIERGRVESLDDVDADVVVVTAGAWIAKLVPDVPVRVTRETIAYFEWDGAPAPSVVELDDETRLHAMYALHDPLYGLKAGAHHAGHEADPDVDEGADPVLVERIVAVGARAFPRRRPDADRGRVVPLHVDRRRVVRARAPRPARDRLGVLGARLQVRARGWAADCAALSAWVRLRVDAVLPAPR